MDHYAYFQLPGLNWNEHYWFRCIGRFAAPGFFFLSGYSRPKFRIRIWFGALYLYLITSVFPLNIVHSPWESILNVCILNSVLYYIPLYQLKNVFAHVLLFVGLEYVKPFLVNTFIPLDNKLHGIQVLILFNEIILKNNIINPFNVHSDTIKA